MSTTLTRITTDLTTRLLAPRSRREDDARREYILNVILCGLVLLAGIYSISALTIAWWVNKSYHIQTAYIALGVCSFCLVLYRLSRAGHAAMASYILVVILYLPTTYSVYRWGLLIEIPLLMYVLIMILSSILLSSQTGIIITLFISGTIAVIHYIHSTHQGVPDLAWVQKAVHINYPIELIVMLSVIMSINWLANREIDHSLKRARRSETLLRKERDNLEHTVVKRTQALKEAQLQQIQGLTSLAEFGQLTSGFFHDLANPLNAVTMRMEFLKQSVAKDNIQSIQEHINEADVALNRLQIFLGSVHKQLMQQGVHTYYAPADEIEQAIDILGYKARESEVEISTKLTPNLRTYGNALRFHQVVVNLLSNAIDACREATQKKIHLELSTSQENIIVTVHDSGIGIQPKVLPHIFDPLFTTKAPGLGLGLGLSTVKHVVEKDLQGTISVTSKSELGTTFTLTFNHQEDPSSHTIN